MKTVTIQIGNTDNKLSQKAWSDFVRDADMYISAYQEERHFFGAGLPFTPFQNAAWVITINEMTDNISRLHRLIKMLCREYHQESIAWTEGETEFISNYETGNKK